MNIAIVTGASSGIGREFAVRIDEKFAPDEIWLIARRKDRLEQLSGELKSTARIIPLDLSEKESLGRLRQMLSDEKPEIKALVNAAGFGKFGSVESQTSDDAEDMINVNVRALTAITQMCIKYMIPGGGIINMASISGYIPLPYLNIYSASKAYVLHFSEALAYELRNRNISVTAVCPYWVASEFIPVAQDTAEGDAINNFMFITYPYSVVKAAVSDSEEGKMLSLPGIVPRIMKIFSKTVPLKLQFTIWNKIRRLN